MHKKSSPENQGAMPILIWNTKTRMFDVPQMNKFKLATGVDCVEHTPVKLPAINWPIAPYSVIVTPTDVAGTSEFWIVCKVDRKSWNRVQSITSIDWNQEVILVAGIKSTYKKAGISTVARYTLESAGSSVTTWHTIYRVVYKLLGSYATSLQGFRLHWLLYWLYK